MLKLLAFILLRRKKSRLEIVRLGGRKVIVRLEEYVPASRFIQKYEDIVT
jgi:hypothetical protein